MEWRGTKGHHILLLIIIVVSCSEFVSGNSCSFQPDSSVQCQNIDFTICQSLHLMAGSNYNNTTSFPNVYGHTNLASAREFLERTFLLEMVRLNCSANTRLLICSAVYPLCFNGLFQRVQPCREMCLEVKESCEQSLFRATGLSWPEPLDCSLFDPFGSELCIWDDRNINCNDARPPSSSSSANSGNRPGTSEEVAATGAEESTLISLSLNCTGRLAKVDNTRASFGNLKGCTEPCHGVYFEGQQDDLVMIWTVGLSMLSVLVSGLIFVTYILSYKLIRRLDTPIFYIAISYVFLGLTNIVSMALGRDAIICDSSVENAYNQSMLVTEGTTSPVCSILFGLTYYFTLCTWSWWIALTLEWSICNVTRTNVGNVWKVVFHVIAWGSSFIFLITALVSGSFAGDPVLQTCWVDKEHRLPYLITPLSLAIAVCSAVVVGVYLHHMLLRNRKLFGRKSHRDRIAVSRNKELAATAIKPKFLVRVGSYVIVYLVVMAVLFCCIFYDYWYRKAWERTYMDCSASSISLQSCESMPANARKPLLQVYMVQIFALLCMGFLSVFWLLRHDYLLGWKYVCCCLLCHRKCRHRGGAGGHRGNDDDDSEEQRHQRELGYPGRSSVVSSSPQGMNGTAESRITTCECECNRYVPSSMVPSIATSREESQV